jgi:arylsulfatase A-like enzyme
MAALAMTACSGQPANDAVAEDEAVRRTPNIVIVYMDDLGYGDLPVYNAASLIDTPRLSAFAAEAMVFTDAHSPSAVCTPSRYGLLTGRYAWRSWLKAGVVGGYSPSVIREGEITLARLLQDQGYDTAAIGKWHLGWGDAEPDMALFMQGFSTERVDFTTPPSIRPTTLGFDYFYGLSASLDFPPYAWIENGVYVQAPTESVEVRGEGLYQDGGFYWRAGESAPDFDFKDVEPQIMNRAAA